MKVKGDSTGRKKIIEWVLTIGIIILTGLMVICAGYTYLCEDDYSFLCGARDALEKYQAGYFSSSLRAGWGYYLSEQGTYLFNFLIYFINAYGRWGLPGFHMVMILNVLLFVGSAWVFFKSFIQEKYMHRLAMLVFLVLAFVPSYSHSLKELFLWYTGLLNYTLEISLLFIAMAFLVVMLREGVSTGKLIACTVLSFLACGGALEVSAVVCAWLLIVYAMFYKKVLANKILLLPFAFSFIGSIINAVAPGNFLRADTYVREGHAGVGDAIRDTIICLGKETKTIWSSPVAIAVLLFVVLFACFGPDIIEKIQISWVQPVVLVVAILIAQLLMLFPVCLGYHMDYLSGGRTAYTFYVLTNVMYMIELALVGLFIKQYMTSNIKKIIPVAAAVVIMLFSLIVIDNRSVDIDEGFAACAARDIKSGNLKDNYTVRSYMINTFDMAQEDSDVILFVPYYECESVYGMGLDETPHSLRNVDVENWKKLKSLTVYYVGLTFPAE